jgi:hypothetical protein
MLWWVFNDNYSQHEETNSKNLGVEIHGSAYAYTCPLVTGVDSIVNYTTFYHYEFFNRSDTSYHDMLAGIHTDVDLGNYLDDYVGCDTSLNIAFAYNSDNDDEGFSGYGLNPPMFNLALLRGPSATPNDGIDNNHNGVTDEPGENCALNHFMYYNNDFTPIGNPISAEQFYDQMRAIWKDGVPVTYGGNGYDTSSSNYTNFMYSGNPYNPGEWSEFSPCIGCQPFAGSDRRFTVSSGPFDLPAHEMRSLDYAYVYTRDPGNPNGASTSYTVNHDQVMRIKQFFETDFFPCGHWIGIDENKEDIFGLNIFPNPAHSAITITLKNNHSEIDFAITDALGKQISVFKNRLTSFRIATDHFSSGVYFLHAKSKEGYSVKRFIVD